MPPDMVDSRVDAVRARLFLHVCFSRARLVRISGTTRSVHLQGRQHVSSCFLFWARGTAVQKL